MKGFLMFFLTILVMMGGVIYYYIKHPSNTTMVRNGANWVLMEQNVSEIKK